MSFDILDAVDKIYIIKENTNNIKATEKLDNSMEKFKT